jgi:Flp pilus assembly protein TadB
VGTDVGSLITSLTNFGGLGIVIAFLIWKDIRADKIRERIEEKHRAQVQLTEERRLDYDKDRLATDKETVATLAGLSSAIQGLNKR